MSYVDIGALNNIRRDLYKKKKKKLLTSDCNSCETIHFTSELFLCATDSLRSTCIYRSEPGHPVIPYNIFR